MDENKNRLQNYFHILCALVVVAVIVIACTKFYKYINGGILFSQEEIDARDTTDLPDTEALDYILPLITDASNILEDDGILTVACFGNNPFSDERGSKNNVCNQVAELTGATVYNCSIPGSYMAALNVTYLGDDYPMDAFSFYWLTTGFCLNNFPVMEDAIAHMEDVSPDMLDSLALLESIDFSTVDVIAIMFDGSDYLAGREMYNDSNFTDPQQFTGSMAAGIQLIQEFYPHIRIIVMSPTYAFGVEDDGSYISSDIKTYGQSFLSTYVIKQAEAAYQLSVSFVDNLYGTIHENIAPDYLIDNIHLNQNGRKFVAQRLADAINTYRDFNKKTDE